MKDGRFISNGCKNLPFTIGISDVRDLMNKQTIDGVLRCAATGCALIKESGYPLSPSLDRIDPNRGYEPGNIRITSYLYNIARNRWSDDETILAFRSIIASLS